MGKWSNPPKIRFCTVPDGEISCGLPAKLGREVYFAPKGFTNESYIGTPLNQAAANSLRYDDMLSSVPYNIKKNASLSTAIEVGLKLCVEKSS